MCPPAQGSARTGGWHCQEMLCVLRSTSLESSREGRGTPEVWERPGTSPPSPVRALRFIGTGFPKGDHTGVGGGKGLLVCSIF